MTLAEFSIMVSLFGCLMYVICIYLHIVMSNTLQGRIQDFKLWGAHLKKLRQAKGGAKIFGVFRVKYHDFTPKNHIFSILGGCAPGAPPLNPPLHCVVFLLCFSSSCVPYVVSFSRLFIFDSPFGIL